MKEKIKDFLYRLNMGELKPLCTFLIVLLVSAIPWIVYIVTH